MPKSDYKLFNKPCYGLEEIKDSSIHAVITDPPYGISFQNLDGIKLYQIYKSGKMCTGY